MLFISSLMLSFNEQSLQVWELETVMEIKSGGCGKYVKPNSYKFRIFLSLLSGFLLLQLRLVIILQILRYNSITGASDRSQDSWWIIPYDSKDICTTTFPANYIKAMYFSSSYRLPIEMIELLLHDEKIGFNLCVSYLLIIMKIICLK